MQQVAPLPRPLAAGIVAALLACATAAWLVTIDEAGSMGRGGIAMVGAALFLITWLVMMVAMMLASVAPMTLAFASVMRSRAEGIVPAAVFFIEKNVRGGELLSRVVGAACILGGLAIIAL